MPRGPLTPPACSTASAGLCLTSTWGACSWWGACCWARLTRSLCLVADGVRPKAERVERAGMRQVLKWLRPGSLNGMTSCSGGSMAEETISGHVLEGL